LNGVADRPVPCFTAGHRTPLATVCSTAGTAAPPARCLRLERRPSSSISLALLRYKVINPSPFFHFWPPQELHHRRLCFPSTPVAPTSSPSSFLPIWRCPNLDPHVSMLAVEALDRRSTPTLPHPPLPTTLPPPANSSESCAPPCYKMEPPRGPRAHGGHGSQAHRR
jgi:hypothetical protein